MTNADIKKVYNNYLKDAMPSDFELNKGILYKNPIEDLLIGFCFEKSGFDKESLYIWAFVMPLYIEKEDLSLTFGHRLKGKKNGELWHLKNNPKIEVVIKELSSLMEKEIQSFLLKVTTASDFYEYFKSKKIKNIRIKEALVYSAIYSEHRESKQLLESFIDELKNEDLEIDWISNVLQKSINLKELLEKEENINTLLEENVKLTKEHIKIV